MRANQTFNLLFTFDEWLQNEMWFEEEEKDDDDDDEKK